MYTSVRSRSSALPVEHQISRPLQAIQRGKRAPCCVSMAIGCCVRTVLLILRSLSVQLLSGPIRVCFWPYQEAETVQPCRACSPPQIQGGARRSLDKSFLRLFGQNSWVPALEFYFSRSRSPQAGAKASFLAYYRFILPVIYGGSYFELGDQWNLSYTHRERGRIRIYLDLDRFDRATCIATAGVLTLGRSHWCVGRGLRTLRLSFYNVVCKALTGVKFHRIASA